MRRTSISLIALLALLFGLAAAAGVLAASGAAARLDPTGAIAGAPTAVPDGTRKLPPPADSIKPGVPVPNAPPAACVAPVVNVSATTGNQQESSVVINPTNPQNIVAFSNLSAGNSIFRAYTMNGGTTWTRGTVATNAACCDAQATFDSFGNLFMIYIGGSNQILVLLSTDGGATFSAPLAVGSGSVDQPSISAGNGSLWVDWNQGGNMVARGAPVTGLGTFGPFNAQQTIPNATGSFGGIAVGPGPNGGKVILTYQNPTGGQGPATIFANVDADGLGAGGFGPRITVSTTNVGGFDFIPAQSGRSIDSEAGVVWDATGGPFNNRIYLIYTEEIVDESNDTDIYVRTSDNDGATWTAPVRVNDDPAVPIRSQFLPYITLDRSTGTVAAGWHDARNDNGVPGSGGTNATPNDDSEYYASYSTNGGTVWAANTRISGGFSNAAAASSGVDYGDYVAQDAFGGKFVAVWADNSNCDGTNANGTLSAFDLYMGTLTLPAGGTPTPTRTGTPATATRTSTVTVTPPPTNTPTATATVNPCQVQNYQVATATGATVVPATTFVTGSNCDDCSSTVALPFPFQLYGQTFNSVNAISNGNLQFNSADTAFGNTCLPYTTANYAILPHWDDLLLTGANQGIYTLVEGSAPNRIFDIEWRGGYFSGGGTVDFEVRLYENSPTGQFDIIYGTVTQTGTSATIGVQKDTGSLFTQFSCNTSSLSAGLKLTFTQPSCGTASPTVPAGTATRTVTPILPTVTLPVPTLTQPAATVTVGATLTAPPGTATLIPVATATLVPVGTTTPLPIFTPTATQTVGPGATVTATVCTVRFQDVGAGDPFYVFIRCLACRGIISGYTCGGAGEPCQPPDNQPYFRTNSLITRAQISKMVSLAAGLNAPIPSGQQTFEDVPSSNPFWPYIERLASAGYISGYACGGASEPCQPPANRPYFRPFASITRGQLAKIDTNAAGYTDVIPSGQQTFEDVPNSNPFWLYIQRASIHGVISGYNCGGPGEPCNPPGNRPYFRAFASTTRGQASKIVANTFFPNCQTP